MAAASADELNEIRLELVKGGSREGRVGGGGETSKLEKSVRGDPRFVIL